MESTRELDNLARRVQQTYYEDGLADLFMGAFMLLFAVVLLAVSELHASPSSPSVAIIILPPIFSSFALSCLFAYLIEAAKKRFVYPRAGYVKVKPLQEGTRRDNIAGLILILTILLGPIIVAVVLAGLPGMIFWLNWVAPVSLGILLGIGPMIVARKYHLKRYYLFAVLPAIIGLLAPWVPTGIPSIYAVFFLTFGIELAAVGSLAAISGLVLFLRFLLRYPIEPVDIEEGDNPSAIL